MSDDIGPRLDLLEKHVIERLEAMEQRLNDKLEALMTTQDDINAAVQQFGGMLTDMDAEVTALGTDVANIQAWIAANPQVDTTDLNNLVASVASHQSNLDTAVSNAGNVLPQQPPAGT